MNMKKILVPGLAVALLAAVAGVIIADHKVAPAIASAPVARLATVPAISEPPTPAVIPAVEIKPQVQPAPVKMQPVIKTQNVAAQAAPSANANGPQDPAARVALGLVGADPAAEQYWTDAIFDPSLSDHEREDLMEDLNEDGLSDPKHPGPEDLSLILNRIQLIEDLAPYADDFMLEHLGEAHKDLVNMLKGVPVQ